MSQIILWRRCFDVLPSLRLKPFLERHFCTSDGGDVTTNAITTPVIIVILSSEATNRKRVSKGAVAGSIASDATDINAVCIDVHLGVMQVFLYRGNIGKGGLAHNFLFFLSVFFIYVNAKKTLTAAASFCCGIWVEYVMYNDAIQKLI